MTLATTRARLLSVIGAVEGVGQVHSRVRNSLDRDEAEDAHLSEGLINSWEVSDTPRRVHGGASAMDRTELAVECLAHYRADDEEDSHGDFVTLLEAVFAELMDPITGFPQIDESGIQVLESPHTPIKLRTGHAAYRCKFAFTLWDVEST